MLRYLSIYCLTVSVGNKNITAVGCELLFEELETLCEPRAGVCVQLKHPD